MSRKKTAMLLLPCLLLLLLVAIIFSGCGSPAADGSEQKKVLQTYLEGLRDKDYAKLEITANPDDMANWPKDPKKFKKFLAQTMDYSSGAIKSWTFEKQPYVDELNNQVIIQAALVTEKYNMGMAFDIRKLADEWRIYGVKVDSQVPIKKDSMRKPQP